MADGGGSNGSRPKRRKRELHRLSTKIGIKIKAHHLPPGTSKWSKIEHRLFSCVSQAWCAPPLVSYRVIIDPISAGTPKTGLTVHRERDDTAYPRGITVSDEEMDAVNITCPVLQGDRRFWDRLLRVVHRQAEDGILDVTAHVDRGARRR